MRAAQEKSIRRFHDIFSKGQLRSYCLGNLYTAVSFLVGIVEAAQEKRAFSRYFSKEQVDGLNSSYIVRSYCLLNIQFVVRM